MINKSLIENYNVLKLEYKYGIQKVLGDYIIPVIFDEIAVVSIRDKNGSPLVKHNVFLTMPVPCVFRVKLGSLYGIIDVEGKELFPVQFQSISFMSSGGMLIIGKNDKFGVSLVNGQEVLPIIYDDISILHFEDKKKDEPFFDNYIKYTFKVKSGNKYGIIDSDGIEILPTLFQSISQLSHEETLIIQKDNKFGIISINGKELAPIIYDQASFLSCSMYSSARAFTFTYNSPIIVKINNLYGVFDYVGNMIIACEYKAIKTYHQQEIDCNQYKDSYRFICKGDKAIDIFTDKGQKIGGQFSQVRYNRKEYQFYAKRDNLYNVYTWNGHILLKNSKTDYVSITSYEEVLIAKFEGKIQIISKNDEIITPLIYSDNKKIINKLLPVKLTETSLWGVINARGEIIIPFEFSDVKIVGNSVIARKEDVWQLFDHNYNLIKELRVSDILTLDEFFDEFIIERVGVNKFISYKSNKFYSEDDYYFLRDSFISPVLLVFFSKFEKWKIIDDRGNFISFEADILKLIRNNAPLLLENDFTFGKYKGRPIEEIIKLNARYIVWLTKNCNWIVFPRHILNTFLKLDDDNTPQYMKWNIQYSDIDTKQQELNKVIITLVERYINLEYKKYLYQEMQNDEDAYDYESEYYSRCEDLYNDNLDPDQQSIDYWNQF
jgi:uncharacterized protein (DUF3820 family)